MGMVDWARDSVARGGVTRLDGRGPGGGGGGMVGRAAAAFGEVTLLGACDAPATAADIGGGGGGGGCGADPATAAAAADAAEVE